MEKIINVTKWLINDERYFVAYTATWCNPCKKIINSFIFSPTSFTSYFNNLISSNK